MSFYRFITGLCGLFIKIFYRVERINTHNIPKDGKILFCANHISNLDPLLIACIKERDFYFLSKEELVRIPILGAIIKKLNVIPIKRGTSDLGALRKSIETLKNGKALLMFPEGTRAKDGKMKEGKDGIALIVKKAECNVLPCAIIGKPKLFSKLKVVYGKPLDMSDLIEEKDNKAITRYIMNEIKNLKEANS